MLATCVAGGPPEGSEDAGVTGAESPVLDRYDFTTAARRFDLPGRLDEISGLAITTDGRLLAHDDERGRVHEIDPLTGRVGKRFDLGENVVRDDFEGIGVVGDRVLLVSSLGFLYETREVDDRAGAPYRRTDLGIGADCEVEGLDYDAVIDALVLACKVATPDRGQIVIHRIPLDPQAPRLAPIRVPKADLAAVGLGDEFDPSAVTVTAEGTLLLLSATSEVIIEIDRAGRIVAGAELRKRRHPQPEGIALGTDGTLYIADEANGQDARLSAYTPRAGAGSVK